MPLRKIGRERPESLKNNLCRVFSPHVGNIGDKAWCHKESLIPAETERN